MVRAAVLVLIVLAGTAAAKSWPAPAGGRSTSGGPEVLFTFDDGPNPTTTPKVLDILASHHIKAVFFMVGSMVDTKNKKVPAIVARILREGHVIGNHTMRHKDLCRKKTTLDDAVADIDEGKAAIERVAAVPMVWFRAPFGVRCDRLDALLAERDIHHLHWDLDPQEWKHGDKVKTVTYVTRSLARATDRNVLLMHDIKTVTVAALPEILTWLDAENEKRSKANQKPIRILQAPELAIEQLPPGLVAFARDATERLGGLRGDLASVLP